ncbi:MAG: ATP synthase F0 subunit B [SAR324 cluster bacterium]|nr:ATP synthase F0 subunit B [SAR324 cluster bacterium]
MSNKEIIVDNAWLGFNMDYGLLHLQLATPVVVFILLLIVIFIMNKLLFQPVFRTLENRKKVTENSKAKAASANVEITKLREEYENQLNAARMDVSDTYTSARQEAQKQRDELIQQVRQAGEAELEKGKKTLVQEIETAKNQLKSLTENLAKITANRLLN